MCQYRKVQDTCRRLSLFNLFNLNASFRAVLKPEDPTPKLSFPIAWIYSCFHIWQFNIRMLDSKSNKLLLPEKKNSCSYYGFCVYWSHPLRPQSTTIEFIQTCYLRISLFEMLSYQNTNLYYFIYFTKKWNKFYLFTFIYFTVYFTKKLKKVVMTPTFVFILIQAIW